MPLVVLAEEHYTITEREFQYRYSVRVQAFSEHHERVTNPVAWMPLAYIVENGAKVNEGDLIAQFNPHFAKYELRNLELESDVVSANLDKLLTDIDNQSLQLEDQLDGLLDNLAMQEARLKRFQEMPLEDDIRIAEGRLRVAQLNLEASQKDYEKGQDRFERGMISKAELDNFKRELDDKQALWVYARDDFEYAKLPAASSTIRRVELEIENSKLEIEKIENELSEQVEIAVIQKDAAQTSKRSIERRIDEKNSDIDSTTVHSPVTGYVSHGLGSDRNPVRLGSKMWKNHTFMKIPDLASLAFKGAVPESVRKYFQEGDPVEIYLTGVGDMPLLGTVRTISSLARDLGEEDEVAYGVSRKEFGVKVYNILFDVESIAEIKPGQQGKAVIESSRKMKRGAVPLRFVYYEEGVAHVSFDGIYQAVSGVMNGGYFYLEDASLVGKKVQMAGVFENEGTTVDDSEKAIYFTGSGEILPENSEEIVVLPMGGWHKLKMMVPEETVVKKGDLVAEIDSTDIDEDIQERENRLNQTKSALEEQKKKVELTKREEAFKLKKAEHLLEIAELNMNTAIRGRDYPAIFSAELSKAQLEIQLAGSKKRLKDNESKKRSSMSPFELERLKRTIEKQELRLQRASIDLETLKEGSDPVTISEAELEFLKKEVEVKIMKRSIEFENLNADITLRDGELDVRRRQRGLNRRLRFKENTKLYSPTDGYIRYNKIWNSGVISKVSVGVAVGSRFSLMTIPDLSSMFLSVEVPEKYYESVKVGMEVDVEIPALQDAKLKGTVSGIDVLFENRTRKDSQIGIYSAQEPLGEVVFKVRVSIATEDVELKPGAIGLVYFPFVREDAI